MLYYMDREEYGLTELLDLSDGVITCQNPVTSSVFRPVKTATEFEGCEDTDDRRGVATVQTETRQ